jgi:hypothetical protein
MVTGFESDNQRIAIRHNNILIELVKAIKELTETLKDKDKT